MDLKTFLVGANNVHVAKHGAESIYIGQDVAKMAGFFQRGGERT